MTDPVNVRIARFIGWTDVQKLEGREKWVGHAPCAECNSTREKTQHGLTTPCLGCWLKGYEPIPDFEGSWGHGGPLIQRFEISLEACTFTGVWAATLSRSRPFISVDGETPLLATCALLLALAEREQEKRA